MTTSPSENKTRNWMRIALVGSLALNLLIVGIFLGAKLSGDGPGDRRGGHNLPIGVLGQALDRDDRRALGAAFRKEMRKTRGAEATRVDGARFLEVLRAPEFSAAELEELMSNQFARSRASFEVGRVLLLEKITEMTPEERAAYADRLEEGVMRKLKNKRKP